VLRSYEEQKRNKACTKIMLPLDSLALGQARLSVEIRQYGAPVFDAHPSGTTAILVILIAGRDLTLKSQ
jgi:hypothetical protein